ncbi:carbohydrate ABC transporter permease [Demequina lignilytica]|uniref:Carbohydrate ABC transporter permease n=1 Tax=Demequina lignilytica TaxID=3051663 RepID=A0AB35MHW1_9MICO|nr:carbohydrate ABC transporter permease [Demequina sp. SYSU T0a273]MDN4483404.1 carbohydrate ABC transporter permease [Demequina sp. SYSU T0a273]
MRTDVDTKERFVISTRDADAPQRRETTRDARAARVWELLGRIALYVALAIVAIPFVMPTWWMITSSFKPVSEIFAYPPTLWPSAPTLQAYVDAFAMQPFARQYFNSLYIAALVTVGTILISSLAGYAFARIRFPGNNMIFMVVLVGLLIPAEVTIVPLFQMFNGWGMVNTHWPLLLATTFGAPSVLATFIMRQFFLTLPQELDEAARLDGLGRFGMWWRISMPLARTAVAAVGIFTFQHVWNLYLEPTVFLQSPEMFTLPQALTRFTDAYGGEMWNVQLAAATMTVIPVLLVFILAQKQFIQGLAHTGLKG